MVKVRVKPQAPTISPKISKLNTWKQNKNLKNLKVASTATPSSSPLTSKKEEGASVG